VRATRLGGEERRHVLVFDKGDEVVASLLQFAKQEQLTAASFTAIGAFSDVTLGFFDARARACPVAGGVAPAARRRRDSH
jgi:predicted DNA-binding protein with PD1-like motif